MTYSVHNLVHVPDDYERFGVLDKASAFTFESYMQKLKGYVGRGGRELQQAVKRRHEESFLEMGSACELDDIAVKKEHERGPLGKFEVSPVEKQYGEVLMGGKRYSTERRDSYVCVGCRFGKIVNFLRIESKLYTLVCFFERIENFFTTPCPSQKVGIVRCKKMRNDLEAVDLKKVQKCIAFDLCQGEFYVCKLLHETVEM